MSRRKTKRLHEQKCCVYKHITLDDNVAFYVGKDENYGKRAYYLGGRNEIHDSIVERHGARVEVIEFVKNHTEAVEREMFWIRELHTYIQDPSGHCEHAANKS